MHPPAGTGLAADRRRRPAPVMEGDPVSKHELRSFHDECADLAHPETFDPSAFKGDAIASQTVCNFVLALALIYNDYKDTMYARIVLDQSRPVGKPERNREWGAFGGIDYHIFRLSIATLHELFELIQRNQAELNDSFLNSVVSQLSPEARRAWKTVVDAALDATPQDDLGKALLLVRNKVAFHYDPKCIFQGYSHHFVGPGKVDDRAYISRGLSMAETRFYFADAAGIGYIQCPRRQQSKIEFQDRKSTRLNSSHLVI